MNRKDITQSVSEITGFSKKDVTKVLDAYYETLFFHLKQGENVKISGFASFEVKEKKDRLGINPQTKERLLIKGRKYVAFKPGKTILNLFEEEK